MFVRIRLQFYPYQGSVAFKVFDSSSRSVNGVVKSTGSIVGALILGFLLDKLPMHRRNRGLVGLAVTAIFITVAYSWGIKYQIPITRATRWPRKINYNDSAFAEARGHLCALRHRRCLLPGFGVLDHGRAIANDPFELARFAGMYKAVQSAGAAAAFAMDATLVSYINEIGAVFGLMLFSFPFAAMVIWGIRDSNYEVEQQVYIDEAAAEATNTVAVLEGGQHAFERQDSPSSEKKIQGVVSLLVSFEFAFGPIAYPNVAFVTRNGFCVVHTDNLDADPVLAYDLRMGNPRCSMLPAMRSTLTPLNNTSQGHQTLEA